MRSANSAENDEVPRLWDGRHVLAVPTPVARALHLVRRNLSGPRRLICGRKTAVGGPTDRQKLMRYRDSGAGVMPVRY